MKERDNYILQNKVIFQERKKMDWTCFVSTYVFILYPEQKIYGETL